MDEIGVITSFLHNIVVFNIPLLYGTAFPLEGSLEN